MCNKIEEMNNRIIALSIMIQDRMATREDLKENTTIDDDVKKIIDEKLIYEIQSLSKQMRKEYRNIEKQACAMRSQTKNVDKMLLANMSQIWGRRSDGR